MACNDCGNTKVDCGCTTEALSISQVCNPVVCATEECSESFKAGCVIYTGDDLLCGAVTVISEGDTAAQIFANLTAYFCSAISTANNYGLFVETAGVALANTAAATSMIGTGEGTMVIASDVLAVGDSFKLKVHGLIHSDVASTLTIQLLANAVVLGTITTAALSITPNESWSFEGEFTVRTIGATGSIYTSGKFSYGITGSIENAIYSMLASAVVDTTIPNTFDLVATYSAADPSNTLSSEVAVFNKIY